MTLQQIQGHGEKNRTMKHRAKKSLGQNFLKSVLALNKIVAAGELTSGDVVLEIGPGKGALTKKLLETGVKVIAVEKDRELFAFLEGKFAKEIREEKLKLLEEDILNFDVGLKKYKIISNIPYNITGAILKKFLAAKEQPERMVLMVQHEVGKRIVGEKSNPSTKLRAKESILSISVKAYGEPKLLMKVPARYFSPAPKVNSAIISIKNISRKVFEENPEFEKRFWEIVKIGFAHKRKKLSGNLKNVVSGEVLSQLELQDKRAEDLSLSDWISLAKT